MSLPPNNNFQAIHVPDNSCNIRTEIPAGESKAAVPTIGSQFDGSHYDFDDQTLVQVVREAELVHSRTGNDCLQAEGSHVVDTT